LAPILFAALLPSGPAQACWEEAFDSVVSKVESFHAVVRARVMQAKVRPLSDFGIACKFLNDPESCSVLELKLQMLEVFNGDAEKYTTINAPVLPVCRNPVLTGLEYVFFLESYDGLIAPNANSFEVYGVEGLKKVQKVRQWKAEQQR
jgi:hypothetical protein